MTLHDLIIGLVWRHLSGDSIEDEHVGMIAMICLYIYKGQNFIQRSAICTTRTTWGPKAQQKKKLIFFCWHYFFNLRVQKQRTSGSDQLFYCTCNLGQRECKSIKLVHVPQNPHSISPRFVPTKGVISAICENVKMWSVNFFILRLANCFFELLSWRLKYVSSRWCNAETIHASVKKEKDTRIQWSLRSKFNHLTSANQRTWSKISNNKISELYNVNITFLCNSLPQAQLVVPLIIWHKLISVGNAFNHRYVRLSAIVRKKTLSNFWAKPFCPSTGKKPLRNLEAYCTRRTTLSLPVNDVITALHADNDES